MLGTKGDAGAFCQGWATAIGSHRRDPAEFPFLPHAQLLPIPIPQLLIYPAIDPLSDKNRVLSSEEQSKILNRLNVPTDKPMLLQVSRFDRFKDALGVIQTYRLFKKHHDVQLVLAGGKATDDPDIHILLLPPDVNLEINALQRATTIVLQKSLREGFGLTVAEAMWKGKPAIGIDGGGITVQLVYGVTGFTINSVQGIAFLVHHLLDNP